jgi:glyoxylase-like metal-dependent hydrolase (beta-lactamase superfamily II)
MTLSYETIVTLPPRSVLPDGTAVRPIPSWSPISSTLIAGERDAILIDGPHTVERAGEVADWVAASGKNLVAMYATHGHGDHYFGFTVVGQRFPSARPIGTAGTVALARSQACGAALERWQSRFPGQIPVGIRPLEVADGHVFRLEGHEIRFVEAGRTDTQDTTFVHVPEISLVVAGDIVYNGVHLYLAETDRQLRREWIGAVDAITALSPADVVAGHKDPSAGNGPQALDETRRYLLDADELLTVARTAEEFVDLMMQRHIGRINPNILWDSARRLIPA